MQRRIDSFGRAAVGGKSLSTAVFALCLCALAAACGEGEGSAAAAARASPADGCAPRILTHKFGETRLAGDVARVVPVSFRDQDAVLALGALPVAVQDGFYALPYTEWPWVRDRLAGAEPTVLAAGELNFEQIAAQRPDLILGSASGLTADEYALLSGIAPTVAQLPDYVDFGVPWQETVREAGRALCREAAADSLVASIEASITQARTRHPVLEGATALVAMAGGAGGSFWLFGPQDSRGRFLTELGLRQPPIVADLASDRFVATLSGERLDLLEADVVLWIASAEQRAELEASPLYRQLAAVREGRVLYLEPEGMLTAAITNTTALNLPYLLETLVPRIVEALGGGTGG